MKSGSMFFAEKKPENFYPILYKFIKYGRPAGSFQEVPYCIKSEIKFPVCPLGFFD